MSKLKQLIQKFCPNGVEYRALVSISNILYGYALDAKLFTEDDSFMPAIRIRDIKSGCTSTYYKGEIPNNYIIQKGDILVGMDGEFNLECWKSADAYLNQRILKLSSKDENIILNRYLYHLMKPIFKKIEQSIMGSTVKHLSDKIIKRITIPLPPIEVQNEIVRILDNFTELIAELTTELTARKKQYSEASYRLLFNNHDVEKITIKDICTLIKGKTPIQKALPGDYPMVVTTTERKTCNTYQFNTKAICIPLISSRGHGVASLNHVYYQEGKFALGNILCAMMPNEENYVNAKYLYYYFECTKDYTLVPLMKGGANVAMHMSDIEKIKVPIPSLEIQQNIVSKLEQMEEYYTILLPAEIEARKKQYEYYRDRLLTFKEKVAS